MFFLTDHLSQKNVYVVLADVYFFMIYHLSHKIICTSGEQEFFPDVPLCQEEKIETEL